MNADVPCLLIGGPGRSGTNVLKDVLSGHPLVLALPFETRFTVDPDGIAPTLRLIRSGVSPFVGEVALQRLDKLLERMERCSLTDTFFGISEHIAGKTFAHRSYRDWELSKVFPDFRDCRKKLLVELTAINYEGLWAGANHKRYQQQRVVCCDDYNGDATDAMRRFLRQLFSTALTRANKKYYVEDNTYNLLYAPELLDILPQAKLVHMVRDPRDVVASYLKQRWTPNALPHAIKYYRIVMEAWLAIREKLPIRRYAEVRLEDLCHDPESTLREIMSWIDWPFDCTLLHADLSRSNTGRWKRDLDSPEQNRLSESLAEYVRILGYN